MLIVRPDGEAVQRARSGHDAQAEPNAALPSPSAKADGVRLPGWTGHGVRRGVHDEVVCAVAAVRSRRGDLGDDFVAGVVQAADRVGPA
jgi:hypothetical protein